MQGFGEPQAPCHAGRAAVIALPDPSACGGEMLFPQPRDTQHTRLQFCHLPWRDAQVWPPCISLGSSVPSMGG